MSDQCAKCGAAVEPGDVKCPACGVELPEVGPPPVNKALVLLATLVPLLGLLLVVVCLAGIVVAAVMYSRGVSKKPVETGPPPAVVLPPAPPSAPVAVTPVVPEPIQPPVAPPVVLPQPPPVAVAPPAIPKVNVEPPVLDDFDPPIVPPGKLLNLRGQGLKEVTRVLLISSHGAASVRATIVSKTTDLVTIVIPNVPFADYGILIAAFSPGGVAVMADQHTGATPWGTDGHLHDTVVCVQPDDSISTQDHMVVLGMPGSEVSIGNDSFAFLREDAKLKGRGDRCHIYFVGPAAPPEGISRQGLNEVPAMSINFDKDLFRVKPATADQDQ